LRKWPLFDDRALEMTYIGYMGNKFIPFEFVSLTQYGATDILRV